ncbi:MAG: DMT family transporter [Thermomonas sp.]|uniref:DMT family transporter n=1 Tax=Thermomonas sp. TaxID=1971895 RepID=UPI001ECF936B|nr:DMT family transporter [Thermomonas sp.]MBV2208870.1 DMT family transporter [Thermomonas sp.]
MHSSDTTRALWQIHFCVLLWGFTAILGKLITLPALPLVWWRMLLVAVALALLPKVWRGLATMSVRTRLAYTGIGALVALHWLTFYGAIKLSNASVAATCMAFATPMTALLEPLLTRQRFRLGDFALGLASLPGIWLVVGGVPAGMHTGILVGVISAFFVALFGSLNKRMVDGSDPLTVTALELGAGALTLTLLAPAIPLLAPSFGDTLLVLPEGMDILWLLVLALACTLLPYALYLVALRHLSAFTAQLSVNLEPIYAIFLAALLFQEQQDLHVRFYIGVAIILIVVFAQGLLASRRKPAHAELAGISEAHQIAE